MEDAVTQAGICRPICQASILINDAPSVNAQADIAVINDSSLCNAQVDIDAGTVNISATPSHNDEFPTSNLNVNDDGEPHQINSAGVQNIVAAQEIQAGQVTSALGKENPHTSGIAGYMEVPQSTATQSMVVHATKSDPCHANADQTDVLGSLKSTAEDQGLAGHASAVMDVCLTDNNISGIPGKNELKKEMELCEAAERGVEVETFKSHHIEKHDEATASDLNHYTVETGQNDEKGAAVIPNKPAPRRKRGRPPGSRKKEEHKEEKFEEDVCFVCFDGGNLLLCDKRSCPKAYHIECTGRESEFFQKRGQWFCGWHVCAYCSKSAKVHCYTCPTAFCKGCVREADFLCIRKGEGLCEVCHPIVQMIEHKETINADGVQVDFNDKETYEGLFKEYWEDLQKKLSLTLPELEKACKAKEAGEHLENGDLDAKHVAEEGGSTDSDTKPTPRRSMRLKRKRLTRSSKAKDTSGSEYEEGEEEGAHADENGNKLKCEHLKAQQFVGWVSKDMADFMLKMKEDPKKQLPISAVRKLLWNYIEEHKLINPLRRGQIVCDEQLQKLFGKKCVGKFELRKLLNSHLAQNNTVSPQAKNNDMLDFENKEDNQPTKISFEKQHKSRRKSDNCNQLKPNPSDFAAIDINNINLIYLKRSLLDSMQNDPELLNRVVGAFVRIRIPGNANKGESCYRLVQILGIKQNPDSQNQEKVTLEILNLQKREEVTADLVSGQDFTEEECQRLRQSVKYGFLKPMRVGELEEKARALREAKVNDWFEAELLRLSHLRDRASEKGRKRELRECVEKLQLLSTPAERQRHLDAPFQINADSAMDPNLNSNDEDIPDEVSSRTLNASNVTEESEAFVKPNPPDAKALVSSGWGQKDFDPGQRGGDWVHAPNDRISEAKQGWGKAPGKVEPASNHQASWGSGWQESSGNAVRNQSWNSQPNLNRPDVPVNRGVETFKADVRMSSSQAEKPGTVGGNSTNWRGRNEESSRPYSLLAQKAGIATGISHATVTTSPPNTGNTTSIANVGNTSEKEKIWHYQDPTKTIQGPFSMEQLRKWEKTKLFPLDLRVWKTTQRQDESILLTDALMGKFSSSNLMNHMHRPSLDASSHVQRAGRDSFSQMGWAVGSSEREYGNASMMSNQSGSIWQGGSGRPDWNQNQNAMGGAFANKLPENNSALGSSWKPAGGINIGWGFQGPSDFHIQKWEGNRRAPDQFQFDKPVLDPRFPNKKKDVPCRYFARGLCLKGQACDFKHE